MNVEQWKKVKEIFHAALEVPDGERTSFLQSSCGDDQTLLVEVQSLFDAHGESAEFIESPAFQAISSLVEDTADPSRIGQTVGAYRIESEIGRGGMGAVYLASRADKAFDKKVAIKLIKRGFDTDEIVRRFRHERQILAGLEHPNITRLLDGGSTDDGLPYLVMDFVDGKPLKEFCDEYKLSIAKRLDIFLRVCSAVSYAHQNLVIHRDLKPSNILVTLEGTPKLLDFGIAKLTAADGETPTIDGTLNFSKAMTPEYASPEQVTGHAVTTASDIYSLGVILYELLTGHRPFKFKSRSADEITRILTDGNPTKPSSVCRSQGLNVSIQNPQAVARTLKGDLDNIVLMAMRREAERRYSSVEQFADDIRRYLAGLPVIAQEDTFGYRASKFVKRNKAGVAAGAGIAASLIGGLIAASRQARIASRQRDRARREARKAEKVNQFLQKMLASADPSRAGKDILVTDMLRIAADSMETEFANQPEIAADLLSTIGLTYLGLGKIDLAETYLKSALDARLALYPRSSVEVAEGLNNYGKLLHGKGELAEAEPLYREALAILRKRRGSNSLDVAEVLDNLGYLVALKGDSVEAVRLHEEELDIRRSNLGENHPDVAGAINRLANVYSIMDRRDLSVPLHRRALKILQTVHGDEHPAVALAMNNLVGAIVSTRPEEAELISRKALAIRRKLLGEDHVDVVWSLYNVAWVLINRKKYAEAEAYVLEALGKRSTNVPDEHPVVASCFLLLGRTLKEKGNFSEARQAFETCLDLRLNNLTADHWLLATTRSFIGECLYRLGETTEGLDMLRDSCEILEKKLGRNHEQTRQAFDRLSSVLESSD